MKPPKRCKAIWESLGWLAYDNQTPLRELVFPAAGGEWAEWDRALSGLSPDDLVTLAIGEVSESQAIADKSPALKRFRVWLEAVFELTGIEGAARRMDAMRRRGGEDAK